jgi:hypothetical protein
MGVQTEKWNPEGQIGVVRLCLEGIGAPIILVRCPSLSAHESESMLGTYLVCREKQERERERERGKKRGRNKQTARGRSTQCTYYQRSYYLNVWVVNWGKIMSLRMLTNLRLAGLRLTTAQQRSSGQNLPSDVYSYFCREKLRCFHSESQWTEDRRQNSCDLTETLYPVCN